MSKGSVNNGNSGESPQKSQGQPGSKGSQPEIIQQQSRQSSAHYHSSSDAGAQISVGQHTVPNAPLTAINESSVNQSEKQLDKKNITGFSNMDHTRGVTGASLDQQQQQDKADGEPNAGTQNQERGQRDSMD